MKKINIYSIIALSYVLSTTTQMIWCYGERNEAYITDWKLIVVGLLVFGGMFFLGYMARRHDEKE